MANKKKVFDRLDNINLPNSSKQEIFNLIEDVENDIDTGNLIVEGFVKTESDAEHTTTQILCNKLRIPSHLIGINNFKDVTLRLSSLRLSTNWNEQPDIFLGTGLSGSLSSQAGLAIDHDMLIGTSPQCIYQLDLPNEYVTDKAPYGYRISFPSGSGGGGGELKISTDGGVFAIKTSTLMLSSGLGMNKGDNTICIKINATEFWFEQKTTPHDTVLRIATEIKNSNAGSIIYAIHPNGYDKVNNIAISSDVLRRVNDKNFLSLLNISTDFNGKEITTATDILWLGSGITKDYNGAIYLNVSTYLAFNKSTTGSDHRLTVSESVKNSLDKINIIGVDNLITKNNFDELLTQKLKELGITN